MNLLNICSNFVYTQLYYNFYNVMKTKCQKCIVYNPVPNTFDFNKCNVYNKDTLVKLISSDENIIISPCFSKLDRFLFASKRRKILVDIEKKIDMSQIDNILAHSALTDGFVAYKFNKKYGTKYSVFVQNTDINFFLKKFPFLINVFNNILLNAQSIIFASNIVRASVENKFIKKKYKEEICKKISVIPFGIDNFYLKNKSCKTEDINLKAEQINFLTVATIDKNKNQISVAQAIDELIKAGYNIKYNIVGRIEDNDEYDKIMKYDFVKYWGAKDSQELLEIYRQNDIFILASYFETFGLVYAEALSQGLPIIYSKGQGFDAQIETGQVGYNVVSSDINSIKDAILLCLNNYRTLCGNAQKYTELFAWNNVVDKYIQAIN